MHMFHPFVPSFCNHSILVGFCKLSRAIHQHIFSRLAGSKINVYMTCLTLQTFSFWFLQTTYFGQFIYVSILLRLNMFQSHVLFICYLSIQVCSHRISRATMDHHPKGSAPLSWCARAIQIPICLLAHINVCLTQFRPHLPVTPTEVKTYLHTKQ